ncbi:hypothetical protein [Polaromonas sp. OV174]|uniref:hypothetical protein n=1 Tax=Polaromonas sp. OV174 TaxID=1855300 RepID=UPI001160D550|nr:hypothetical protein [Polaromonas sp. OV174]
MNTRFISNRPTWLAWLLFSAWASAASAQALPYPRPDPQPTAQAADPATPVPAVPYRSAFAKLSNGVEQRRDDWKKANAEVGQFKNGHADLLKWEAAQASQPSSAPARAAQP